MVLLTDQAEQAEQDNPSRFLGTMEEMLGSTVQVEMAEQTECLVSQLEQMVRQIQETGV